MASAPDPSPDIVACGLNVVDVLFIAPENICRGGKHPADQLTIQGGGPAANAACLLASLGWRTTFVGHFGENSASAIARDEFTRHGVLPDLFLNTPAATPAVAVVQVEPRSGERTVFYTINTYRHLTADDVPTAAIRAARLLLVDSYESEAALASLHVAQEAGVPSVLDLEAGETGQLLEMLRLGTDAILPLEAAQRLSGENSPEACLRALARHAPQATLVTTDGLRGSWALQPSGALIHQPAFRVEAVDTTGCGDAYHGAYASALLHGWPLPLRMEFAAWIASRIALALGGRANLPTPGTLRTSNLSALSPELQSAIQESC